MHKMYLSDRDVFENTSFMCNSSAQKGHCRWRSLNARPPALKEAPANVITTHQLNNFNANM